MVSPKQLRRIATNPTANMRFQTTGQLPRVIRPQSPLIDLLISIFPRDRAAIVGLQVGSELGYMGRRSFHNAEQALRWVRPDTEMLENESWPAESHRLKAFQGRLFAEHLVEQASSVPDGFLQRYPSLRRPVDQAHALEVRDLLSRLGSTQLQVDENRVVHEGFGVYRFDCKFLGDERAFHVRAEDRQEARELFQAVVANRCRPDYLADVKAREDADGEYQAGLEMTGNSEALREARKEWALTRPVIGDRIHGEPVEAADDIRGDSPVQRPRPRA